ncbi:MAG: tetratricopeptide (TPR) repeat protein [Polyangiales bacterium]
MLAVVASSAPVWAQEESEAGNDAVARELFEAAEFSVERGDYERALGLFQQAFELSDRPELLFNAANAAERLRQDELALELYVSYLERLPEAVNRPAVEARIEQLRGLDVEESEQGGSSNLWAWVTGSTAVVFTALGVAGRVRGNSVFSNLEEECGSSLGCTDERLNGSSLQAWDRTTVISFSIAGAAAVGFVVALILDRDTDEDDAALRVGIGPSSIQIGGTF